MDEFEKDSKTKWYLVNKNNIDLILKVIILGKVCQIWCQNSNFCYFQREKPNQTRINKIKLPHEIWLKIYIVYWLVDTGDPRISWFHNS